MQRYSGYAPADLAVLEEFRLRALRPEPGFIVDFIGVRTRATSLWREVQELAGTIVPPPVPSDFHAEAVERIGLLKAVKDARDQFVMMELGAGWGPWLVAGATAARAASASSGCSGWMPTRSMCGSCASTSLRIPTKPAIDSDRNQPPIPIEASQAFQTGSASRGRRFGLRTATFGSGASRPRQVWWF